ncbi:MLP-like protein 423 [Macadamia integrifolia]|uniref:MLP-like protein 423 n=1 Tax=Macadamia integrifolia TaxID=60698 RepID=UPI001C4F5EAC|nr:MLP-like protein 423 [Macadamia integrifolia]
MAVTTGKLEIETEIQSPADKFFAIYKNHANLFTKVSPDVFKNTEIIRGCGKSVNSVLHIKYAWGGHDALIAMEKIESIDDENKTLIKSFFEGDIGKMYKTYRVTMQAMSKGGKNSVKWSIEYEKVHEEVPAPTTYLDFIVKLAKDFDAHILKT